MLKFIFKEYKIWAFQKSSKNRDYNLFLDRLKDQRLDSYVIILFVLPLLIAYCLFFTAVSLCRT